MDPLKKALDRSRAVTNTAQAGAIRLKQVGGLDFANAGLEGLQDFANQRSDQERYSQYRSWVYSAVNALALEASGQPVNVARMKGAKPRSEQRSMPSAVKQWNQRKMTATAGNKTAREEFEVVQEHLLLDILDRPNDIQDRGQFVYSFVANLNLTGWAFVIGGENEKGELEFYSMPTTWVHPIHKPTRFAKFKIMNPDEPNSEEKILDRRNVGFAYMPDPRNLLAALAPIQSQMPAIRIDDHIQISQEQFFENGVFPSVVIAIGKQPFGDGVPTRPMLTGPQRRQVEGAINRKWSGTVNSGKPAIVDGLIESITRLSATQNEMGWKESEQSVKARILSAFSVHPFILGEAVGIGGHAQAFQIKEIFYSRVNVYLDMLSNLMTNLAAPQAAEHLKSNERLLVWWEKKEAVDRSIHSQNVREGRKNGDITRNEYRTFVGLPPDETAVENRSVLLSTVGGMTGAVQIFNAMGLGSISKESAAKLLALFFEISEDVANDLVGVGAISVPVAIDELQAAVQALSKPIKVEMTSAAMEKLLKQEIDRCSEGHE